MKAFTTAILWSVSSLAICLASVTAVQADAVLSVTTMIDFTGFTANGFESSPGAGQLDSDTWRVTGLSDGDGTFGGTHNVGDFARGSSGGGVVTGGIYAFDVGDNTVLGVQPTGGDMTPGTSTLRVLNDTGTTLTDLLVEYEVFVYNDQDRANSLKFSHSSDDSAYFDVATLDFTSLEAADPSPTWSATTRSTVLSGLTLADGDPYYLRWTSDDVSGSGSRDEFALDNVKVTPRPLPLPKAIWIGLAMLAGIAASRWVRHRSETLSTHR